MRWTIEDNIVVAIRLVNLQKFSTLFGIKVNSAANSTMADIINLR